MLQDISAMTQKKRVSKKQVQIMAGKLNWASTVHSWGRAYMSSLFHAIRQLNKSDHKMIVTTAMQEDLQWWLSCLQTSQHCRAIWPDEAQTIAIATDASLVGGGGFLPTTGDFVYANWALDRPDIANTHINVKELAMIGEALTRWAPMFPGHHFCVQTDNVTAAHHVNKGYAKGYYPSKILKDIEVIAHGYQITISAHYLPGVSNEIPDGISRLHSSSEFARLSSLLSILSRPAGHQTYFLPLHMSPASCLFLLPQVLKYHSSANWMRK